MSPIKVAYDRAFWSFRVLLSSSIVVVSCHSISLECVPEHHYLYTSSRFQLLHHTILLFWSAIVAWKIRAWMNSNYSFLDIEELLSTHFVSSDSKFEWTRQISQTLSTCLLSFKMYIRDSFDFRVLIQILNNHSRYFLVSHTPTLSCHEHFSIILTSRCTFERMIRSIPLWAAWHVLNPLKKSLSTFICLLIFKFTRTRSGWQNRSGRFEVWIRR